jgi:hypothetical protein
LWPHSVGPFCLTHAKTWKVNGSPDPADFAARFDQDQVPEYYSSRSSFVDGF